MCYKISMKTKGLYFVTVIVLLFITIGTMYAEENLIKNSSFEELSANGIPVNWRTHSWAKGDSTIQFGSDKETAHSGNNSVFVNNFSENHGYYIQTVAVNETSSYKISGWIKTENIRDGADGAGISLLNLFEVGGNFKGTTDWQYAELYVTTRSGIYAIEVMLQLGNYGGLTTGKAWFDDITITKVNSIPPGAIVSVVSKEESSQKEVVPDSQKDTPEETKNQGTFVFLIIVIIIVIIAGIAVVVIIIITRKKTGVPDKDKKDETQEEGQEPKTEDKT